MCIALGDAYKAEYASTKEKLAAIPKGRQFTFDEAVLFNKYNIFTRRLEKLIDMFTSVHQVHTHTPEIQTTDFLSLGCVFRLVSCI